MLTLHLGDPSDPVSSEQNGHFGIVTEGSTVWSGKLADPNLSASVNPVDGARTIDATTNVRYV